MALQRTIDKAAFAALPDTLKTEYIEREGKYVLNVDDSPMLSALEAERRAKKDLESKLASYGNLTPEQAKQLQEQTTKAEREKDFAQGNFEKILAEERAKHAKDQEIWEQRTSGLRSTLQSALIDAEAVRAITQHGGNAALLLPIIKQRTKLQTVGDREVAVVYGDQGGPLLRAGAKGSEDFMPIGEFVATLKADKTYGGAFASTVGSGSGSPRPSGRPTNAGQQFSGKIAQAIKDGATVLTKDMG